MANFPDNQVPVSGNPWALWGVRIWGPIAPSDWNDMQYWFYTHWANTGKGWLHSWYDVADRDALHEEIREFWMMYICTSWAESWNVYILSNVAMGGIDNNKLNNSNWILLSVWVSWTPITDNFLLSSVDVSNWYVTMLEIPDTTRHINVYANWILLDEWPSDDYTRTWQQVNLIPSLLIVWEKITVKYYK